MERWEIDRYRRPALVSCEVSPTGDDVLTIGIGDDAVDLSFEGVARDEVAQVIAQLMRPASPIWTKLVNDECPTWIRALTEQLDALSLIEETDSGLDKVNAGAERAMGLCAEVGQRLAAVVERRLPMYKETLTLVHRMLDDDAQHAEAAASQFPFAGNFALQALQFQLTYLRQHAPEIVIAWRRVLAEVFRHACWFPATARSNRSRGQHGAVRDNFRAVAAVDPADLETYLLSFAHFIEIAPLRVGKRMTSIETGHKPDPCSGLTLAARTERMLQQALDQMGANTYATAVAACDEINPLVKGLYIEQFHVTDRFVEIIAPLLTKRLKRSVRARLFQYFQEEIGHEAFELATCVALGMNEADVQHSVPLPLTALYIDAYTVIAHRMPVAFFASIMVTEGLRGQHSPVHAHIASLIEAQFKAGDVVSKHADTNDELNHPSLSRLFLADVPYVSPAELQYSLDAALFLLEVNMRQLESVALFYGGQQHLQFHGLHDGRRTLEV